MAVPAVLDTWISTPRARAMNIAPRICPPVDSRRACADRSFRRGVSPRYLVEQSRRTSRLSVVLAAWLQKITAEYLDEEENT